MYLCGMHYPPGSHLDGVSHQTVYCGITVHSAEFSDPPLTQDPKQRVVMQVVLLHFVKPQGGPRAISQLDMFS